MVMGRVRMVRMERLLRRVLMLVDGELPLLLRPVAADGLHQQLLLRRLRLRLDGVLLLKVLKDLLLRVHLPLNLPDGVLLLKVSKDLLLKDHLPLNLLDGVLLLKVSRDLLLRDYLPLSLLDGVPLLQLLNLPRLVAGVLKHQLLLLPSTTTIITDGDLRRLVLPDGKVSEVTMDRARPTDLRCFPCSFLGT
jgi:hypothetical protein